MDEDKNEKGFDNKVNNDNHNHNHKNNPKEMKKWLKKYDFSLFIVVGYF